MAANEIPIAGYGSTLLSRAEVAEGTMVFHFGEMSAGRVFLIAAMIIDRSPER
ncbi:MAG: hypothetical protein WB607_01265 [Candidatus Acidiferrum sp.]